MELPIGDLPIWSHLNDVTFFDAKVTNSDGKGYGVICQRKLSTHDDPIDKPILLSVPHTLVLNAEAVEEYAKQDRNFRQLLEAVGHRVYSPPLKERAMGADIAAVSEG